MTKRNPQPRVFVVDPPKHVNTKEETIPVMTELTFDQRRLVLMALKAKERSLIHGEAPRADSVIAFRQLITLFSPKET